MKLLLPTAICVILANAVAVPLHQEENFLIDRDDTLKETYLSPPSTSGEPRSIVSRATVLAPKPKPQPKVGEPENPNAPAPLKPEPAKPAPPKPVPPKTNPLAEVPGESTMWQKCYMPPGTSFFYSSVGDKAELYSAQAGRKIVHDAYPPMYTEMFSGRDGKPRKQAQRVEFAKRVSKVYAEKTQGEVHVMTPWETGPNPDFFFHEVEWPILKKLMREGKVTKVIQVNPNNFAEKREYDPTRYGLTKRDDKTLDQAAKGIDLNNVPWDVEMDALFRRYEMEGIGNDVAESAS